VEIPAVVIIAIVVAITVSVIVTTMITVMVAVVALNLRFVSRSSLGTMAAALRQGRKRRQHQASGKNQPKTNWASHLHSSF